MCIRNVRLKENIDTTPMKELQISSNIKGFKDIMEGIESFNSFEVNTSGGDKYCGACKAFRRSC